MQLAEKLNGVWHGDAHHAIFCFSSLACATSTDLCYFDNMAFCSILASTSAGAVLLRSEHTQWCSTNMIVVSNPFEAMKKAAHLFENIRNRPSSIHPTAQVHASAQFGQFVSIGANTIIGCHAVLADHVVIGSNCVVEPNVIIGCESRIGHGVQLLTGSQLGKKVIVDSGAVIGANPFNNEKKQGIWHHGPVAGGVIIGNNVQIGANTVITRGTLSDTYLADGVCIDNLVQIAHDVIIGANTAIAACAVLASHVQVGSDCIIGGGSCVAAYARLADNIVVTGMSAVSKSLNKPGIYSSGTLVHEHQRWRRNAARFRRLDDYVTRLVGLEKYVAMENDK